MANPTADRAQTGVDASSALAEVRAHQAPAGVDEHTWRMLQEELARVIEAVGRASVPADAGGAALSGRDPGEDGRLWPSLITGRDARAPDCGQGRPPSKTTSSPPMSGGSKAVLTLDVSTGNGTLKWGLYLAGDYNQDGQVSAADLSPLGQRYGEASPGGAGTPFPPDSSGAVVDGSGDGVIGLTDIAPIGQNYARRVMGYRVYRSHDAADVPQVAADANGPGAELVADVALADAIVESGKRKRFEHALSDPAAGWFFWVRPYDGVEEGTPSNGMPGPANDNLAPIAVVQAQPGGGLAPLTVTLDGFNSMDLDGTIVKYEWDFDGPVGGEQWVDTGGTGWTEHTYDAVGDYLPALRVTDNLGARATAYTTVKARAANPPVAAVSATPDSGPTVLHVVFDAGASSDPDGPLAKYEWDWNSDGVYDYDSGTQRKVDYYFYGSGYFTITMRVTDLDGFTATAQTNVNVGAGAAWNATGVLSEDEVAMPNAEFHGPLQVIDVGGKPGIFFLCVSTTADDCALMYCSAQDTGGTAWNAPVRVDALKSIMGDDVENYAATIAGIPAIVYRGYGDKTWYVRAQTSDGVNWAPPVWVEVADMPATQLIELTSGPAFVDQSGHLYRSTDHLGDTWVDGGVIVPGMGGNTYRPTSIKLVNGKPAILYGAYPGTLWFLMSDDLLGYSWSRQPSLTSGTIQGAISGNSIVTILGFPASCYYGSVGGSAFFLRANDPDGITWCTPFPVALNCDPDVGEGIGLASCANRPFIIYKDIYTFKLNMIAANDSEGKFWGIPIPSVPTYADQVHGLMSALSSVNECPALAYIDLINTPGEPMYILTYESYY